MGERLCQIQNREGRNLGFAQWGGLAGVPVFWLHGTPGSRFGLPADEEALRRIGVHLITYDRPGYGMSERAPGRRIVDCVADVEQIADTLGIDHFRVIGRSGGGPHALALAARLPDRVIRAGCVAGPVPADAAGLDWMDGMDPKNQEEFGWAEQGERVLQAELEREAVALLDRIEADPSQVLSEDWGVDPADRQVLAIPQMQRMLGEMLREAYRAGVWGWVDDDLAYLQPWGFDLGEITVPVQVCYGTKDVLVPPTHGVWLVEHIPGAQAVVLNDAGHLTDPETMLELLRSLIAVDR